jgi:uncharacterized membrane protein
MIRPEKFNNRYFSFLLILVVLLVSLFAGSAVLKPYQLFGHSAEMDLIRLTTLDAGIKAGDLFPRWSPFTYHGYGSPLLNFYASFSYYVAEVFVLLGFSVMWGIKAAYVVALMAAGLFMYLLCRELSGPWAGLAGGCLYVLAPYVLVETYVRSAMAELTVFGEIALALYFLVRFVRGGGIGFMLASAATFALIVMTHNISSLIYTPLFLLFCLMALPGRKKWLGMLVVPFALTLSLFFWLPAIVLKSHIFAEECLTRGFFAYTNHFLWPQQLLLHEWGYGTPNIGPDDHMALMIGVVHLAGVAIAAWGLFLLRKADKPCITFLVFLAIGIFFSLPISRPIWDMLPLIRFVQFPWRFLMVIVPAGTLLSAAAVGMAGERFGNRGAAMFAVLFVLAALLVYGKYVDARFIIWDSAKNKSVMLDLKDMRTAATSKNFVQVQHLLEPEGMIRLGVRGTSLDDFLPRWVSKKPRRPPQHRFKAIGHEDLILAEKWAFNRFQTHVDNAASVKMSCAVFYFPGWQCRIDGDFVPIEPLGASGIVSFTVPAGSHRIEVTYQDTLLQQVCETVSIIAWLALGIACIELKRRKKRDKNLAELPNQ